MATEHKENFEMVLGGKSRLATLRCQTFSGKATSSLSSTTATGMTADKVVPLSSRGNLPTRYSASAPLPNSQTTKSRGPSSSPSSDLTSRWDWSASSPPSASGIIAAAVRARETQPQLPQSFLPQSSELRRTPYLHKHPW